jgi:hypothetical protein
VFGRLLFMGDGGCECGVAGELPTIGGIEPRGDMGEPSGARLRRSMANLCRDAKLSGLDLVRRCPLITVLEGCIEANTNNIVSDADEKKKWAIMVST